MGRKSFTFSRAEPEVKGAWGAHEINDRSLKI